MTSSLKSWDEYAADQRQATKDELVAVRKLLQWVIVLLIAIVLIVGLPLMYVLAQS